jgi:hypothetical protein
METFDQCKPERNQALELSAKIGQLKPQPVVVAQAENSGFSGPGSPISTGQSRTSNRYLASESD